MCIRTGIRDVYQGVQGACPRRAVTCAEGTAERRAVGAGLRLVIIDSLLPPPLCFAPQKQRSTVLQASESKWWSLVSLANAFSVEKRQLGYNHRIHALPGATSDIQLSVDFPESRRGCGSGFSERSQPPLGYACRPSLFKKGSLHHCSKLTRRLLG